MSVQVKRRRETAAFLSNYTGAAGELLVDTTNNRVLVQDGATPGGFPVARLSDVIPVVAPSAHGASVVYQWIEQVITCSGPTTDIPISVTGVIECVALRVLTAVTGCASITVNDSQNGDSHWGNDIGISAGATNAGVASPGPYFNGSTILALAAVGGAASFTGGTVRVSVLIKIVTPPTS